MTQPLDETRILDAAEGVLRRFGPAKTSVTDVARALGVSHGAIYRHFDSKAALRDAVTRRWLHAVAGPLSAFVTAPGPAPDRLAGWFRALHEAKREKQRADPELFAMYHALASEAREVVGAHVAELTGQLAAILAQGSAAGELRAADPAATARALFAAMVRFHHPVHAEDWLRPGCEAEREAVLALLLAALRP